MKYIDHISINGVRGDIPVTQAKSGAPTTKTEGRVGQLYMDTATGDLYKCTAAGATYVWVKIEISSGGDSPIELIENTDKTNKKPLRSLDSGTYILKGYFTAYEGSTASYTFSTGMLVAVVKTTSISYVQIFYPKDNCIQYLYITDTEVTRKDAKLVNMESIANKVTEVSDSSDDSHYPSAKAVNDAIVAAKPEIVTPSATAANGQAADAKSVYDAMRSISSSGSTGYSGVLYYGNGSTHAYNPIVNTTAQNARCEKLSRLIQSAANNPLLASSPETLAHECAIDNNGYMTWVENTVGTAADTPGIDGITCVKGRKYTISSINNYSFPNKAPEFWGDTVTTIAQKGDIATNTLTGESFELPGGVGYQTLIDGNVICGYVPAYAKVAGMTCVLSSSSGVISVLNRKTWTLSIDGTVGEYNYNRLPAGLTNATLHPSNQIAKINSVYYRADVVPNNGFVVFSSGDLINWTYLGHATFPNDFRDMSEVEACCGAKRSRLYVAVRQKSESGCLYLAKMNADMTTINSCVALPDCGSKPCFTTEFKSGSEKTYGILLATASANRYGCRVYLIPTDYDMSHIYPMFEIQNNACNYPFIANVGGLTLIAGTNGAQTDKNGVSLVQIGVYTDAYSIELQSTDNYVFTVNGTVTYGDPYSTIDVVAPSADAKTGEAADAKAVWNMIGNVKTAVDSI